MKTSHARPHNPPLLQAGSFSITIPSVLIQMAGRSEEQAKCAEDPMGTAAV